MNPKEDQLYVVAGEGRVVPFHQDDRPPNMETDYLRPGDGPIAVPNTVGNRRAIRSGDLVEVAPPNTMQAAHDAEDLLATPAKK